MESGVGVGSQKQGATFTDNSTELNPVGAVVDAIPEGSIAINTGYCNTGRIVICITIISEQCGIDQITDKC